MKKITFLLLMVFMMSISFGNNYTTADKIKILKQFQEFQKSVEKENKSKILNYIAFPAEMNFKKIFLERFSIKPASEAPEIEIYQLWLFEKIS